MSDALDRLLKAGHLKVQTSSESELAGFLANADQALVDAQIPSLSSANRFKLAYDAAHSLALAAMRALSPGDVCRVDPADVPANPDVLTRKYPRIVTRP